MLSQEYNLQVTVQWVHSGHRPTPKFCWRRRQVFAYTLS